MSTFEEVQQHYPQKSHNHLGFNSQSMDPLNKRMCVIIGVVILITLMFLIIAPTVSLEESTIQSMQSQVANTLNTRGGTVLQLDRSQINNVFSITKLSPIFRPEVKYWSSKIIAWASERNVEPNLIATIMQVESCGDPQAVSPSGAQGLFQVMPFHFAEGENMLDPDTNAQRGITYFVERLQQTNGNRGLAFAGYNGGHRAAASSYDTWAFETQRYYWWTTGIMADIEAGYSESPTIERWLAAGGANLCRQAAQHLGLIP